MDYLSSDEIILFGDPFVVSKGLLLGTQLGKISNRGNTDVGAYIQTFIETEAKQLKLSRETYSILQHLIRATIQLLDSYYTGASYISPLNDILTSAYGARNRVYGIVNIIERTYVVLKIFELLNVDIKIFEGGDVIQQLRTINDALNTTPVYLFDQNSLLALTMKNLIQRTLSGDVRTAGEKLYLGSARKQGPNGSTSSLKDEGAMSRLRYNI